MNHPRVGIGVLVIKNGQILLGERVNSHGAGTWCPPGGHLEFGESPKECAARELQEEASLVAENILLGPWTNDFFEKEEKHYITLYLIVTRFRGVPSVEEPEKCSRWDWFDCDLLPSPLFLSFSNLIHQRPLPELLSDYAVELS